MLMIRPVILRRWLRALPTFSFLGVSDAGCRLRELCAEIAELRWAPPMFLVEVTGPHLMQVVARQGQIVDVCQERHWAVDVLFRGPLGSAYDQVHGVRIIVPEDGWPAESPLSVRFTTSIEHIYVDGEDTGEVRIAAGNLFQSSALDGRARHSLLAGLTRLHFSLGGPLVPLSADMAEAWQMYIEEHTRRMAAALAYTPRRANSVLFSHAWDDEWLNPRLRFALLEDAQHSEFLQGSSTVCPCSADGTAESFPHDRARCQVGDAASKSAPGEPLRRLAREVLPGVFEVPALAQGFSDALRGELNHFLAAGAAPRRPNNHHRYGAIASDMGLEPLMLAVLRRVVAPLARALFPSEGAQLDAQHSFFVRYRHDQDTHLDNHHDDSDVTFNVALGASPWASGVQTEEDDGPSGTELHFCGLVGAPHHRVHSGSYRPRPGFAIVHLGRHRHGVMPITSGERQSLIIWGRSSAWRRTSQGAYQREARAPDVRCLSYTHDVDYGKYKAYPPESTEAAGNAWCPPSGFEHT